MTDLPDYSGDLMEGEYEPLAFIESFSKETLAKLVYDLSKLYVVLSGHFENAIEKRYGREHIHEISLEAFTEADPTLIKWLFKDDLGIKGNDVATYLKLVQAHPGAGFIYTTEVELENPTHGFFSFTHCPTLEFWERTNDDEHIEQVCTVGGTDWKLFRGLAKTINPKLNVELVKHPPRESKDEVPCRWEVTLEP